MGNLSQGGSSVQARLKEREEHITSLQKEGEVLARKNGELEASMRKVRASLKESDADKTRLLNRLRQQDEILDAERDRFEQTSAQHMLQVRSIDANLQNLLFITSEH